jgi:hypothetical protein
VCILEFLSAVLTSAVYVIHLNVPLFVRREKYVKCVLSVVNYFTEINNCKFSLDEKEEVWIFLIISKRF